MSRDLALRLAARMWNRPASYWLGVIVGVSVCLLGMAYALSPASADRVTAIALAVLSGSALWDMLFEARADVVSRAVRVFGIGALVSLGISLSCVVWGAGRSVDLAISALSLLFLAVVLSSFALAMRDKRKAMTLESNALPSRGFEVIPDGKHT